MLLRSRRTLIALFAAGLAFSVTVAACSTRVDDAPTIEKQEQRKGPAQTVIDTAFEHGDLSAEQELTLQAISDGLSADREDKRELRAEMRASVTTIVRSGSTDSPEFAEAVDRAAQAIEARIRLGHDAIKETHALLDAGQRAAVADALRERIAERWNARDRRRGRMGKLARRLLLTPEQVETFKAVREELKTENKDMRPTREEIESLVDAFEGEDFAAALDAFRDKRLPLLRKHLMKAGDHADTVLSILEPDQRELLADFIEEARPSEADAKSAK